MTILIPLCAFREATGVAIGVDGSPVPWFPWWLLPEAFPALLVPEDLREEHDVESSTPALPSARRKCEERVVTTSCEEAVFKKEFHYRTSLVAQWLRIHLPTQRIQVRAPVREDTTCHRAAKPVSHNYWARVPQQRAACTLPQLEKACTPGACALQQEKPLQWEARAPQRRAAPARHN